MSVLYIRDGDGNFVPINTIQGKKGDSGYTPEKGKDYWTEDDKEEIHAYIDEAVSNLPSGGGGDGWKKLGDITVSGTYEFNLISFTGGVVTLDTSAEGYSFMNKAQNYTLFHPIDITSNLEPQLYQLRPKDYAAGTFDVYNFDGVAQPSASIDITKYKMSVQNIGYLKMTDIPECNRYKMRYTFPVLSTHGIRALFSSNVVEFGFDACCVIQRSGGVILERELFILPNTPEYMLERSTVVYGNYYGMNPNATHEGVVIIPAGAGKTKPVNGVVEFYPSAWFVFVNGARLELWGANDDA